MDSWDCGNARLIAPLRRIGRLLTLASCLVFVVSGTGCSRDPQVAADLGKKIDLTLRKPEVRAEMLQKPAHKSEAIAKKSEATSEKERQEVQNSGAPVEPDLSKSVSTTSRAGPASARMTKKKARKKPVKERAAAEINQQPPGTTSMRPETIGDGVIPKNGQDARPSNGVKLYQDSDNPLHPSYKKK